MPELVTVQLERPTDRHPGQVTFGFYIVKDGQVIMTNEGGVPMDAGRFKATLRPNDNPASIAKVLTLQVRNAVQGVSSVQRKFRRRLEAPRMGVA